MRPTYRALFAFLGILFASALLISLYLWLCGLSDNNNSYDDYFRAKISSINKSSCRETGITECNGVKDCFSKVYVSIKMLNLILQLYFLHLYWK